VSALLPMAAALVIGLFLGWLVSAVVSLAAMSRSQERMQRKVDFWHDQLVLAQREIDRLARLLDGRDDGPNAAPGRGWK
jgi:hypothetical protein